MRVFCEIVMLRHNFMLLIVVALLIITDAVAQHENKIEPRIVNGIDALRSQFPYYAYLIVKRPQLLQDANICGGSLISRDVILTAGHCLANATNVEVHLGTLRAQDYAEIGREMIILGSNDLHIHPEFPRKSPL